MTSYNQQTEDEIDTNIIILSAFIENNIKLQIDQEEQLDMKPFQFSLDYIIISSTFTKTATIFAFLVSDFQQKRYLILYDIDLMEEIEREEVENDSFLLTTSTDIENSLFDIFILSSHSITKFKGEKIETQFQILSIFPLLNGEFLIQTDDGSIFGYDPKLNELFKKGNLPIISMLHSIQQNFLLCVSERDDSFFIPFSLKGSVSEMSIKLNDLPRVNLFLNPNTTTAIFQSNSNVNNTKLIAASGTRISTYSCTIPYASQKMDEITRIFNEQITYIDSNRAVTVNEKVRIFSITDFIQSEEGEIIDFIATTKKYSTSFYGRFAISFNPTIELKTFCEENIVQIHKKGIKSLNSDFEWISNDKEVVACSIGADSIVLILTDSTAIFFDRDFHEFIPEQKILDLDKESSRITCATFCNSYVAVATSLRENQSDDKKAYLTVYPLEFDQIISQISLVSPIVSLAFIAEKQALFASTESGNVLEWHVDESGEVNNDFCSTIFINQSMPSYIVPIGTDLLIASTDLFIYNGQSVLPIQVGSLLSICIIDDDSFYVLLESLEIYRVRITRDDKYLFKISEFNVSKPPRRIVASDQYILSMSRSKDFFESYIDFLNQNDFSQFYFNINSNVESGIEKFDEGGFAPISMIEVPSQSCFLIGMANTGENNCLLTNSGTLLVLTIDGENQRFSVINKIDVPGIPYSMKVFNDDEVFLGINNKVYVLSTQEWKLFKDKEIAVVPTQTSFIDFFNETELADKFVWIADRNQSIFCFKSYQNEVTQHALLDLVAVDTEQRQITAICPLNRQAVAVGDKFGVISVLRLSEGLMSGAPLWGQWNTPERGAPIPAGIHLEKVATFSVGQVITSLLINRHNKVNPVNFNRQTAIHTIVFFYTTLFGQVGAVVQINSDEEFAILKDAEQMAQRICEEEFGFVHLRRFRDAERSVVSSRLFDFIEQTGSEITQKIEEDLNFPYQQIRSLLCRYIAVANF